MANKLALINTGCANINSVWYALKRIAADVQLVESPSELAQFDRALLPGVGHAKAAMQSLHAREWQTVLQQWQKPLLGICLGMQLLTEFSEEGNVDGLALIPGRVNAMATGTLPCPHMGWNQLSAVQAHPLLKGISEGDYLYFVHSFARPVDEYTLASCDYGDAFSAIIAKQHVAGMQFHPERSGAAGARLLQNFMEWQP